MSDMPSHIMRSDEMRDIDKLGAALVGKCHAAAIVMFSDNPEIDTRSVGIGVAVQALMRASQLEGDDGFNQLCFAIGIGIGAQMGDLTLPELYSLTECLGRGVATGRQEVIDAVGSMPTAGSA